MIFNQIFKNLNQFEKGYIVAPGDLIVITTY